MATGHAGSRGGDRDAFGAELLQLASERLGDREQARAVVAHAVEALRRRGHAGERVGNPKAFLFQTVRNLTAERPSPGPLYGKLPHLRGGEERELARGASGSIAGFGAEPDPHRRLRAYALCIGKLTRRDRRVLLLRRLHGLKTAQVAERTGLPAAMVEDRLAAALRRCWREVRPPAHAKLEQRDPVLLGLSWYARLEGGTLDRAELRELEIWLREDGGHARAFRVAEALWRDSALLQAAFDAEGKDRRARGGGGRGLLPNLLRRRGA
jgi:DNA-directed RNA polymerase specialized sigma24 family protein